jgi:hypothetical protein
MNDDGMDERLLHPNGSLFMKTKISSYTFGWKKVNLFIGMNLITWLYAIDGIYYLHNCEIFFQLEKLKKTF